MKVGRRLLYFACSNPNAISAQQAAEGRSDERPDSRTRQRSKYYAWDPLLRRFSVHDHDSRSGRSFAHCVRHLGIRYGKFARPAFASSWEQIGVLARAGARGQSRSARFYATRSGRLPVLMGRSGVGTRRSKIAITGIIWERHQTVQRVEGAECSRHVVRSGEPMFGLAQQ